MANRGHVIPIGADTRPFENGVRSGVIAPIEDAETALKDLSGIDAGADLARDLDKAGDAARGAGDDLERAMRDAQQATGKAGGEVDDMRRKLDRAGRQAKDTGREGKAGLHKIEEGASEVRQEIGQNMGEAFSSFRGNLEDIGQIGQDTLGGLAATVAGTGPGGIVGALGLAAGAGAWGIIMGQIEAQNQKAQELRDNLVQAYQDAGAAGKAYADEAAIAAAAVADAADPGKKNEAQKQANALGVDWRDVLRAQNGDLEAQNALIDAGKKKEADLNAQRDAHNKSTAKGGGVVNNMQKESAYVRSLTGEYENMRKTATETNRSMESQADRNAAALGRQALKTGEATDRTDELGNEIRTLHGKEVVIDAKTGKAYNDITYLEKTANRATQRRTMQVDADFSPFNAAVAQMRRTGLRPIKINLDASVTYRDQKGRLIQ